MSERYSSVFRLVPNLYTQGSPLVIVAGALLKDNETGKVLAQIKFRNIVNRTVKAVKVKIYGYDAAGNALGDAVEFQYLDLAVGVNGEFGAKTPVYLTEKNIRSYTVEILQILFEDQEPQTLAGAAWEPLPEQVLIEDAYELSYDEQYELLKQYHLTYGKDSKYQPMQTKDLWLCTCGTANRSGTDCSHCGQNLAALESVDWDQLKADKDVRLVEEEKLLKKRILIGAIAAVAAILFIWLLSISATIQKFKDSYTYKEFLNLVKAADSSQPNGYIRVAKYHHLAKKVVIEADYTDDAIDAKAKDTTSEKHLEYIAECVEADAVTDSAIEHFEHIENVQRVVYIVKLNGVTIFKEDSKKDEPYYRWDVDLMKKSAVDRAKKEMQAFVEKGDYKGAIDYLEDIEDDVFNLAQDDDLCNMVVQAAVRKMKDCCAANDYEQAMFDLPEKYLEKVNETTAEYEDYYSYVRGMRGYRNGWYSIAKSIEYLEKVKAGFKDRDAALNQMKTELAIFAGKTFNGQVSGNKIYKILAEKDGNVKVGYATENKTYGGYNFHYYSKFDLSRKINDDGSILIFGKDISEIWTFTTDGTQIFVGGNDAHTGMKDYYGTYTLAQ